LDLIVFDVAALYKRRWDIKVFFKFVKQHLQMKHFLSHSQHGMQIYLTIILITAILLLMFKAKTKQAGFKKWPFYAFTLHVQKFHALLLVKLSGGNVDKIRGLLIFSILSTSDSCGNCTLFIKMTRINPLSFTLLIQKRIHFFLTLNKDPFVHILSMIFKS
jgi:hypothetical protein